MKITKEVKRAIRKAAENYGNVYQLSKKLGIAHSTILFWLDGKTSSISGDIWYEKVRPVIKPFMDYTNERPSELHMVTEVPGTYATEVKAAKELNEVPVLNFAEAAGYDPAFEPFDDYALNCSGETALFDLEIRPGYFALKVDGDSMSPVLPDGTIIYIAGGEYAQNGDLVVAKIRASGQVVVKKFRREDDTIVLESINPSGQSFNWKVSEEPLAWMWPVIEYTVKARQQRWEKSKRPMRRFIDSK
ncbi:MAG: hypothetical protein A2017_04415 [Lentisphaerae bacterium GWF2_44_16]|nr:MAG: hypothetical protein A2017_04415 [Lentisphaerae bacterium GWF2_44_16]